MIVQVPIGVEVDVELVGLVVTVSVSDMDVVVCVAVSLIEVVDIVSVVWRERIGGKRVRSEPSQAKFPKAFPQ